jgi:hypothetical protein
MRRKPVLQVVLCLGVVALLGVVASPAAAAAATCADCTCRPMAHRLPTASSWPPSPTAPPATGAKWQEKVGHSWADVRDHFATIGATGTYSWTFTVRNAVSPASTP